MNNFREVNNDFFKDWFDAREEILFNKLTEQDKKYPIYFDEISEKILNNVPKQNQKYVQKQLDRLEQNYMDYIIYWNEKYYRNGFCDGVEMFIKSLNL